MLGGPSQQSDPDPPGVRVLLYDAESGQQVLAERLHEARAMAVGEEVRVVVQPTPHASQQGEEHLLEADLWEDKVLQVRTDSMHMYAPSVVPSIHMYVLLIHLYPLKYVPSIHSHVCTPSIHMYTCTLNTYATCMYP